jgi:hypothetical protein
MSRTPDHGGSRQRGRRTREHRLAIPAQEDQALRDLFPRAATNNFKICSYEKK